MMYSFAQRSDTIVVDEPLYAHYLQWSNAQHPGRDEVLATQENNAEMVLRNLQVLETENPIVFIKHMTHHLSGLQWNFLLNTKNIILLRSPAKVFQSYIKVIPNPTIEDLGIKHSFALYHYLKTYHAHFIIADSDDILKNPEAMLQKICAACEIPFDDCMLQWKPGARKEDGIWAKYWYQNVHRSTGFSPYSQVKLSQEIMENPIVQEANKYYDILLQHAIN